MLAQPQRTDNKLLKCAAIVGISRAIYGDMGLTSVAFPQQPEVVVTWEPLEQASQNALAHGHTSEPNIEATRYANYSDEQLVFLAQRDDTAAFAELVRRHSTSCLNRAFLILRNHSDAEDEMQNAMLKAFECLKQFSFRGTFGAWLCRIVQNQCLMLIRDRSQATHLSVDAPTKTNARLEVVNQKPDQEEDLGAQQVDRLVHDEIAHLPSLMRKVITLRDVQGRPMPEVADTLGLTVSAAKSRLMRARKELRCRLRRHCGRNGLRSLRQRTVHAKAEYTYVS